MIFWILGAAAVLLGAVAVAAGVAAVVLHRGNWNLLLRRPPRRVGSLAWEDLGPTPLGEKRYTPQGMTYANGRILLANSWKDTKSRVYEFDPDGMKLLRTFDMPPDAVHTSGLAFDGRYLWAVDHISNRCYKIDLEESLRAGEPRLAGSFPTGLDGTSACCLLEWDGQTCLAISDYRRSNKTHVIRHEEALARGEMASCTVFSYTNEGFSQGLVSDGRYLYEAENKAGIDIVNQMALAVLERTGSARRATIRQFNAPGGGVEDLAWDGERIYTSDEIALRFYRTGVPDV